MATIYKKSVFFLLINLIALSAFSQSNAFRITINGNNYSDETIIRLLNGASQNFDSNYDAWKLISPNPNVPSIYTHDISGQNLSINSLPEFTEDKSITIYTNIPVSGNYIISYEEIYGLTSNYKISLSDISSNTHFRLLGDTALSFNFNSQQNSPSFTFNISTLCTSIATNETCFNMADGSLLVNNPGNTDWNIKIIDDLNNVIVNSTSNMVSNNYYNLPPGNYITEVSSKGIVDEVNFAILPATNLVANFSLNKDTIYLSEGGFLDITNLSQNAQDYSWDFGDGNSSIMANPIYNYSMIDDYIITLQSSNTNCTSFAIKSVTVLQSPTVITSVQNFEGKIFSISIIEEGIFQLNSKNLSTKTILVYDISGNEVFTAHTNKENYTFSLLNYSSGIYIVNVISDTGEIIRKKIYR
jgi:PKD repeat protein